MGLIMKKIKFVLKTMLCIAFALPVMQVDAMKGRRGRESDLERALKESRRTHRLEEIRRGRDNQNLRKDDLSLALALSLRQTQIDQEKRLKKQEDDELKYAKKLSRIIEETKEEVPQFIQKTKSKKIKSVSFVDQIIDTQDIVLGAMKIGKDYSLPDNRFAIIKRLSHNVVVVQMAPPEQIGAQCGLNAFQNSQLLCEKANLKELLRALYDKKTYTNEIENLAERLKVFREVSFHEAMLLDFQSKQDSANYLGNSSMVSSEEMMLLNANKFCAQVGNIHRSIFRAQGKTKSKELLRTTAVYDAYCRWIKKRDSQKQTPEVFIVDIGGHWVTIMVERMSNGMLGIVLIDSIWKSLIEIDSIDKVKAYRDWLRPLSEIFVS